MRLLLDQISRIGWQANDPEEIKLQKTLLVAFSGIIALCAAIWGAIYYYFDAPTAAYIPWFYAVISMISLLVFSQTKSHTVFRFSQLILSLLLPFLLMISLGGFKDSSGVIIWALMSPLGALVLQNKRNALYWFLAYLLLLTIGLFLEGNYTTNNTLPAYMINAFFVLNITGLSLTCFVLVRHFVGEKNLALTILEKKHQWIKNAFSAYVSPNLVNHLIQHPEELKLGGVRRECTFVFTDLVGFTPLVEQSDPEELVAYLNEYFAGMTAIVFKHDGTVSKIVGDAIAVMFSAPVVQEDHAERAVACALEMDQYAQQFAAEKAKQGVDIGRTRIGVNTGTVILGNIGSKNQLDYRALGDAINTAARLESVNKQLGTRVCVSESTVAKCPNFQGRPIGSLILKGKSKPVATFEPLYLKQINKTNFKQYMQAFGLLENNAMEALKVFTDLLKNHPQDRLAAYHLARLQAGDTGETIVLPWK